MYGLTVVELAGETSRSGFGDCPAASWRANRTQAVDQVAIHAGGQGAGSLRRHL